MSKCATAILLDSKNVLIWISEAAWKLIFGGDLALVLKSWKMDSICENQNLVPGRRDTPGFRRSQIRTTIGIPLEMVEWKYQTWPLGKVEWLPFLCTVVRLSLGKVSESTADYSCIVRPVEIPLSVLTKSQLGLGVSTLSTQPKHLKSVFSSDRLIYIIPPTSPLSAGVMGWGIMEN